MTTYVRIKHSAQSIIYQAEDAIITSQEGVKFQFRANTNALIMNYMQSYSRPFTKYGWITTKRDSDFDIMSTYFLRISSCISVEDGPVGFGPENQMG